MIDTKQESVAVEDLTVHRVSATERPRFLFLICHGYGAPGSDLVSIGGELIKSSSVIAENVAFAFPEAPISLGGVAPFESRAWWHLDVEALERAMVRGETLDRRDECPDALPQVRAQVGRVLDHELARLGLSADQALVGGFSQGAMLTTDLALHMDQAPAQLFAYSGTLLCQSAWREAAPARKGLPVLQSHGRQDPLLPFGAAESLRDLLVEHGLVVEFVPFDGPHTIPIEALLATRFRLESLVESAAALRSRTGDSE